MSKKTKLIIIAAITLIILSWAGWELFKPKPKDSYNQQEISIKQADIPKIETKTYEDWSGFTFNYPSNLTVKEVELDNPQVYSSLEIYGSDGKKMTIRVSDTTETNLADWQKNFIAANAVKKIDQTKVDDLDAVTMQSGAPAMITTIAINNGILYRLESQFDNGFWDRVHADLTESFKFNNTVQNEAASAEAPASQNETITLVEEAIE